MTMFLAKFLLQPRKIYLFLLSVPALLRPVAVPTDHTKASYRASSEGAKTEGGPHTQDGNLLVDMWG